MMAIKIKWIAACLTLVTASPLLARQSSVVGTVYPIKERDALVAIKQRASQIDWQQAMAKYSTSWQSTQQMPLPVVAKDLIRFHQPIHYLEREIVDPQGKVIYPSGFAFNPLDFTKLPFRIVVIAFDQLAWFKPHIKKTDRVLLTQGDVFKAREILGKTVFLLDRQTQQALNVLRVPTIIRQKGNLFEYQEIKPPD